MAENIINEADSTTELESSYPRPVQIVNVDLETREFVLDEKALASILLNEKVKNRNVAVVSIAGDFRKGKSFMLNFFLRYLKNLERNTPEKWLEDKEQPLKGFSWRSGADRDTTGILMWSEPILIRQNGEQIAVLLMDTQGAFDDEHTVKDSATVFALSTLLSSIQVYNLFHNLQEDNLQVLQIFTEYGRLALEDSKEAPFQKLMFLIRDWGFPFEFDFGLAGGRKFLEKKLTIKDNHPPQLKSVRKHIRSCFKEIECFLMPYPGKKVATSHSFDGRLEGIEEDFIEQLSTFVPLMLDPENIQVKEIARQRLTGIQLMEYFKIYLDIFKGEDMPEPKSMLEATAEANNLAAVATARDLYSKEMEDLCGSSKPYVNPRHLDDKHAEVMERALNCFHGIPKMGGASFSEPFIKCLNEQLHEMYEQFKLINKSKNSFSMLGSPVIFFFWFAFCLLVSKIFDTIGLVAISNLFLMCGTASFGLVILYMICKYQGIYPELVVGMENLADIIWCHVMTLVMKFAQHQVSGFVPTSGRETN